MMGPGVTRKPDSFSTRIACIATTAHEKGCRERVVIMNTFRIEHCADAIPINRCFLIVLCCLVMPIHAQEPVQESVRPPAVPAVEQTPPAQAPPEVTAEHILVPTLPETATPTSPADQPAAPAVEEHAPVPVDESVPPTPTEEKTPLKWEKFDPTKSYTSLIYPGIAAKLGLTDMQRAEVQRLLAERARKLAAAREESWEPIILESETKLAEVLNPEQQKLWPKVFEEKKMRFIFQGQKWADVLELFARQAGLQLIMDAPPPGTFTYSDSREYTPGEAIDKLNGVLQTNGYALLRNDRMLMLFNLKKGRIPAQFLPKIKPEELSERGEFEYVSVVFPLGRRNRSLVLQTIEPFKGPYCHIIPLTGNSLLVTDTASVLRIIEKVIEGVHEAPAPPAPPAPPSWQVYAFNKIDAAEADGILKTFFPEAKSLRIGTMPHLYLYARAAEHEGIKSLVDLLESLEGTELKREIATYPIDTLLPMSPRQLWQLSRTGRIRPGSAAAAPGIGPSGLSPSGINPLDEAGSVPKELANLIRLSTPGVFVSETPINGKLVVLATAGDHVKIKALIDSLKDASANLAEEEQPVVKLYRFTDANKKMDAETVEMIRSAVSDVKTVFDETEGRLLVVATPPEHKLIAEAVAQIDAAVVPVEGRSLVVYRLAGPALTRLRLAVSAMKSAELKGVLELNEAGTNGISPISA